MLITHTRTHAHTHTHTQTHVLQPSGFCPVLTGEPVAETVWI